MTQVPSGPATGPGKGKAFFDRAEQVAGTGNWDFAIQLYLEGIEREPDNLERGHRPLREVSLKRKAQGGKNPGMVEKLKHRPGKEPLRNLINNEFLLAKEPGSLMYMEQVFKSAQALNLPRVIDWICDILLETQRQAPKPSKRILVMLTQAYDSIAEYGKAVQACDMAVKVDPNDPALFEALRELSAKYTIKAGKYDQEGDFVKGVKDMDRQKELIQRDSLVKDRKYLLGQVQETGKEWEASPTVGGKVLAHVDALLAMADEEHENKAIEVLQKAHQLTGAYQYKMRIGDIRMRQISRRYRETKAKGDQQGAMEIARQQLAFELQEFSDRVANYPTDLGMKYELGRRQFLAGKFDDAIASLQAARREPRRAVQAMNYLGQAFARKGLLREAADTFAKALELEMTEDRVKEVRYSLGDVLEQMGDLPKAQDEFSRVAQIDYNYKDVRVRLENIRNKIEGQAGKA